MLSVVRWAKVGRELKSADPMYWNVLWKHLNQRFMPCETHVPSRDFLKKLSMLMNRCDYEKKVIRKTFLNEWLNFYLRNANIENIFPKVHFFHCCTSSVYLSIKDCQVCNLCFSIYLLSKVRAKLILKNRKEWWWVNMFCWIKTSNDF